MKDIDCVIFMFYTFMLNKSKKVEMLKQMVDFIVENVDEEKLMAMHHNRSGLLARQLFLYN